MAGLVSLSDGSCERFRKRWAAGAALLALVLQLVASFGHFHADDFKALAHVELVAAGSDAAGTPAGGGHGLPTYDGCAICVVLHMVGGAALPTAPMLAVPPAAVTTIPVSSPGWRIAWPAHYLFLTRGPPHA